MARKLAMLFTAAAVTGGTLVAPVGGSAAGAVAPSRVEHVNGTFTLHITETGTSQRGPLLFITATSSDRFFGPISGPATGVDSAIVDTRTGDVRLLRVDETIDATLAGVGTGTLRLSAVGTESAAGAFELRLAIASGSGALRRVRGSGRLVGTESATGASGVYSATITVG